MSDGIVRLQSDRLLGMLGGLTLTLRIGQQTRVCVSVLRVLTQQAAQLPLGHFMPMLRQQQTNSVQWIHRLIFK